MWYAGIANIIAFEILFILFLFVICSIDYILVTQRLSMEQAHSSNHTVLIQISPSIWYFFCFSEFSTQFTFQARVSPLRLYILADKQTYICCVWINMKWKLNELINKIILNLTNVNNGMKNHEFSIEISRLFLSNK